jgi:hypothetical protein
VAEVLFGCIVGLLVSLVMSKVWLIQTPAKQAQPAGAPDSVGKGVGDKTGR